MKIHLSIIVFLLGISISYAQTETASLLLQSPDGKTVKLIWFFKTWSKDITGFDIKRREGQGEWEKLNKSAIYPGVSANKDMAAVETDIAETKRIKAKVQKLISEKKLKEIDTKAYLEKLNGDNSALQGLAYVIALDYDLALANGFAFVDRSVTRKKKYEYALFIENGGNMLASASWQYGDQPDLNVIKDLATVPTAKKGKVQLTWKADTVKMKAAYVAGFNIYRDGKKLNQSIVMAAGSSDHTSFSWFDSSVNSVAQYQVNAVTIFGIEGPRSSYSYNVGDHPDEYKSAEVGEISSEGDNFSNGIKVAWTFPKEYEKYLAGFYVEKDNMPAGYKQVSELVNANARSFVDKTPSPVASYIRFRVITIYKDQTRIESQQKLYYYFPTVKPPKPQHLTAKWVKENGKLMVDLSWDEKAKDDTLTESYIIYASNPVSNKFYQEAGLEPIKGHNYKYEIQYESASQYKFCVAALSIYKTESLLSDTAKVLVPSLQLPYPAISNTTLDSNKVTISWNYPDIWDLKGFRIYQNGNIVASEYELHKDAKFFTTPGLKWGANYSFSVQAVSETGVVSDVSVPATISIQAAAKK